MALNWVLHSACHVLGYPKEQNNMVSYEKDGGHRGCAYDDGVMGQKEKNVPSEVVSGFQMPLHYPRYRKADYEKMEEWKVDLLLKEYGLSFKGNLDEKREFAIGAFLWPDQY